MLKQSTLTFEGIQFLFMLFFSICQSEGNKLVYSKLFKEYSPEMIKIKECDI